jgi:hypothetical protein
MPPEIHKSLVSVATDNRRSMNAQLLTILEEWLTEHGYAPWPKKAKRK